VVPQSDEAKQKCPTGLTLPSLNTVTISEYIACWLKWAAEDIARYP
jgi:hypothetical protein